MSCELGLKEATGPTGALNTESTGVAALMAGQPPVAVFPGDERQVDLRGQRLRPMAAVAPRPSAAVSGQADEASAPRGGGAFLLAQGLHLIIVEAHRVPLRY